MKEENETIIKALNMYGRVPKQWELLNEIERLNNIINKGIEYIEERYNGEVLTHTFSKENVGELLNILKGVDKE